MLTVVLMLSAFQTPSWATDPSEVYGACHFYSTTAEYMADELYKGRIYDETHWLWLREEVQKGQSKILRQNTAILLNAVYMHPDVLPKQWFSLIWQACVVGWDGLPFRLPITEWPPYITQWPPK
jgi:hypothetical protein